MNYYSDEPKVYPVISTSRVKAVHIKHLATLYLTRNPTIHATLALTKCGRKLCNYQDVTGISDHYTSGNPYMVNCPRCFKEETNHV
jgi:hypothetical protein